MAVIGAIARKGNVVCQLIEAADKYTLSNFVRQTVSDQVSLVATDEAAGYGADTKVAALRRRSLLFLASR